MPGAVRLLAPLARRLIAAADRRRDGRAFSAAAVLYGLAHRAAPHRVDLLVQRGNMLKDAGRFEAAEAAYEAALAARPDSADTHLQLGRLLALAGRRGEADSAFRKALALDPDLAGARTALDRADPRPASAEPEVASEPAIAASAPAEPAEPTLADALVREADRLRDERAFADAADAYGRVIALLPDRADLHVQHGNMLKDSGRLEEAARAYRAAATLAPADPEPHVGLGHLANLAGDPAAARAGFERALALDPGRDDARHELVMVGLKEHQEEAFLRRLGSGEQAAVEAAALHIQTLEEEARRLRSSLRDVLTRAATPIGLFHHYLAAHAIPAPPATSPRRPVVLVDGDALTVTDVHRVISGWSSQAHPTFDLAIIGGGDEVLGAVGRIAVADDRLRSIAAADLPAVLATAEAGGAPVVIAAPGAVPHPLALSWLLHATARSGAWGAVADATVDGGDASGVARAAEPVLRSPPDPVLLRYGAPFDVGTLLAEPPYAEADVRDLGGLLALSSRRFQRDPRIAHVAYPLFAVPARPGGMADASAAATTPHGRAEGRIAVIVPTRDNGGDVEAFVTSLRQRAHRQEDVDILVVDNGSRDPATLAVLERLDDEGRIRLCRLDAPFNWSWLNNEAVRRTEAPLLLFANDDMVMLSDGWDGEVRRLLSDADVGAVGAHLVYGDGTIQHAGVLLGWKGSVIHDGLDDPADDPGPDGRRRHRRSAAAVTGAFLATRRATFERLGGFDDRLLPIAYSDIDYCLKARTEGLAVVVTPEIRLLHHESKSRGPDHRTPERHARNLEERAVMARRWGTILDVDVTLNPHWLQDTRPWRLLRWPSPDRIEAHLDATGRGRTWVRPMEGTAPPKVRSGSGEARG